MTDWNAVSAFMANVVAWPASPQDPGYVNLHYSMEVAQVGAPKKMIKGMGWPFKDLDSFVRRASWLGTTTQFKDAWFCTSLQSTAGKNTKGNPKAVRGASNALLQKSIWIDLDVNDPTDTDMSEVAVKRRAKKYDNVNDALSAVLLFAKTVGLPQPSAIVFSGGGVHVYWISDDPLTPAEWQLYASGLKNLLLANAVKCDAGLTTDIARILRIPGTQNFKYNPPKPVQLSPLPLVMYDFPTKLQFLTQFSGPIGAATPKADGHSLFADAAAAAAFKGAKAVFTAPGPGLEAGIVKDEAVLLDPRPIFKECGFFREALRNGGADYDNALWMYSVLGTTWMENGNAIAHEISKGHPTYSADSTQALYDRKMADRADRNIGYPSCSTIAGAGCTSCASCPLFAKGKSPLHIRPVTATVTPTAGQTPAARALELPDGYDVNEKGYICKVVEKVNKEGETMTSMVPLFQCTLTDFWVQKHPDVLNYTVSVDKGFTHAAAVPHTEMSKSTFRSFLGTEACRTLIDTSGAQYLEGFYLSILGKLRNAVAAQQAVPFGWYKEGTRVKGFVFGGNVMLDDGSVRPCGIGDPAIKKAYTPVGDINDWYMAARTVTDRKRPELTSILLMAFASPLLALEGKNSTMFSVWGDTAAGKSSAYQCGMAVWGNPKTTKGSETSTRNSITTQMGETKNLPFYWDEISEDKFRDLLASVMHEASDGVQKARNLTGQKAQERLSWKLMICAASNGSYREYLHQRNPNHAASIVRVLEWKVNPINNGPGMLDDADATAILATLDDSYGMMGLKYGQFLATNHAMIQAEIKALSKSLEASLNPVKRTDTRYWIASITLMILAAKYAQQMGVDVDPAEIETFMREVYNENRTDMERHGMGKGAGVQPTEMMLARYFKERNAEDRVIWCNYMHAVQGKPPKPVTILRGPQQARNNMGGVEIRLNVENRTIIIAAKDFEPWIREHKGTVTQINEGLEKEFGATFNDKLKLGSGTIHAAPLREPCIIIPVVPGTDLWDWLLQHTDPAGRAAAEAQQPEPIVDTGFETMEAAVG